MPLHDGDTWELSARDDNMLVGSLTFKNADFPWVICDFDPTAEFEKYEQLFRDESELAERIAISDDEDTVQAWESKYQEITEQLKLVALGDANPIIDFLLHIYENEAHFRA